MTPHVEAIPRVRRTSHRAHAQIAAAGDDIKALQQEVKEIQREFVQLRLEFAGLIRVVERLAADLERHRENAAHDRENLLLRLENLLLRFERGLREISQQFCREGRGLSNNLAEALRGLGLVAWERGELEQAAALLRESLSVYQRMPVPSKGHVAKSLSALARVMERQGHPERAARLCRAAQRICQDFGFVDAGEDESLSALRAALGEEAFAAAWAEGRAMPLAKALRYALEAGAGEPRLGREADSGGGRPPGEGALLGPDPGADG